MGIKKHVRASNTLNDNPYDPTTNRVFFSALEKAFTDAANGENAEKQSAYLRNRFPFFGIPKPLRFQIEKDVMNQFSFSLSQIEELWGKKEREFHYAAITLAKRNKKMHTPEWFPLFERMIRENAWWDTVDDVAANLVGPLVMKYPSFIDKMDSWVKDPDLWIRRTSLLYQLKWKEKTDEKRLFKTISYLMKENDFFIRKAIGWVLREYSKTHPQAVRAFILQHDCSLSNLSKREGSKYL